MLLEEVVLQLLKTSGYIVVDKVGNDPTLCSCHSGLQVLGRGGKHQIDAIADYFLPAPFSHPQRLLVEAKCYSSNSPVGLPIMRNAVGVIKDVSEWWNSPSVLRRVGSTSRYHYQYALFSASGYTVDAERYAFAQDIYLIPYHNSKFIEPVINTIRQFNYNDFVASGNNNISVNMTLFRAYVRHLLRNEPITPFVLPGDVSRLVQQLVNQVTAIKGSLLAVIGRNFPIHLIPAPGIDVYSLQSKYKVRITWDKVSWYLEDANTASRLFSFDLPLELFNLYAEDGRLNASRALDLKSEVLSEFHAIIKFEESVRFIEFELDKNWIERIRQQIKNYHGVKKQGLD
jgi:hypothetical protein